MVDFNRRPIGTKFIQPTSLNVSDSVATLESFIPIQFLKDNEKSFNVVDCAIAKLLKKSLISDNILRIGKVTGVINEVTINMPIKKSALVTGVTEGIIDTLNTSAYINDREKGMALFKDQIVGKILSKEGDSGAPVVKKDDNKLIGMNMAGDDKKGTALINDINLILELLKVDVYISG